MKIIKVMCQCTLLSFLVFPVAAFSQAAAKLTEQDTQAIQALATRYFEVLAACDAEGFANLFVPKTGYFASGFRGRMVGRDRLIALVQSERHCDVPTGTPPAARQGASTRPAVVLTATATGAHGLTDLGTAQYEDDYSLTAQGWKIAARTVITTPEKEAGLDAQGLSAIHALLGSELVDYYVTNKEGVKRLMTSGVALRIVDGRVTGHAYVSNGGYNDDVYEKTSKGSWQIKSRTLVAAESAKKP